MSHMYVEGSGRITIDGIENVEPLISVIWGEHTVYTTMSLYDKKDGPRRYIMRGYTNGSCTAVQKSPRRPICLGDFVSSLTEEEAAAAKKNISVIIDLIST